MKRVFIQTFGCQMNEYDSQRALGFLSGDRYIPTGDPNEADLIFLNTCTVREKPEQKVYSYLGRFRVLKKRRPGLILAVAGCVAQQEGERLLNRVPDLDLVIGTHNLHQLPHLLRRVEETGARLSATEIHRNVDTRFLNPISDRFPNRVSAFLTIMEGCDKFCTFCIVPYVRGREISRPHEKILQDIEEMVSHGVKEVTLLGQNVNSYGKRGGDSIPFAELLRRVDRIPELERIRFTSSYPGDLNQEQMECFRDLSKLSHHLHLPVQSGSNRVLKRMRRRYTREEFLEKVEMLRELCPDIAISTDWIVGFPGETDQDFEETLDLLKRIRFDSAFSFKFSPRPETPASYYEDPVPEEVRERRLRILQEIQGEITRERLKEKVGSIGKVLVEAKSPHREDWVTGRLSGNQIVHFPGPSSLIGEMVPVRIEESLGNSLIGEPFTIENENRRSLKEAVHGF